MTNPQKGKEEAKRRQIESNHSKILIFDACVEEYNDENGGGGLNIVIKRDELGEKKIEKIKD
jgi:hypothetical protein